MIADPICIACKLAPYPAEGPCSRKQACRTRRDRVARNEANSPDDPPPPDGPPATRTG